MPPGMDGGMKKKRLWREMYMPLPKLEVKNASKNFPGVKALVDVDFYLNPGEIVSLVGENGAGKSTLINVITGQILPDEGELYIDGKKVAIASPTDALNLGVGLVPQELNLIPQMSVAENIYLGTCKVKGGMPRIDWKAMRNKAEEIIKNLDAKIDVTKNVDNMSVADQQMVQIARALCLGADILIFDEPTACLTLKETEKLLSIIRKFKEEGKSIIFVSHHLDEVIEISDRVSIMRDGALIENLGKGELSVTRLINGMIGREADKGEILRREVNTGEVILKVEHLSRKREFQDISFDVKRGEIFGIAGLVGAGRTELVSTVFGVQRPETGAIWLDGEELSLRGPHDAIKKGIGYVSEERRKYGILPTMTIKENLTIANLKSIYRFPMIRKKEEEEMFRTYSEQVQVKMASPEGLLTKLSGGNQQKVVVARWLAANCKLLIVDEPTRGIDVLAKNEIHKLMRKCADEGLTILAVSSELEELIKICNRILIMHEGRQKGMVDASEITPEQILHIALT